MFIRSGKIRVRKIRFSGKDFLSNALLVRISLVFTCLLFAVDVHGAGECPRTQATPFAGVSLHGDQELVSMFRDAGEYRRWAGRCLMSMQDYDRGSHVYSLIDIRSPTAFAHGHPRGALNLTVDSIGERSFLRSKSLVLLDESGTKVESVYACRQLREKGFANIRVLDGGLQAFEKFYGESAINGRSRPKSVIDSRELYIESRFRTVLALYLTSIDSGNISNNFEHELILDGLPSAEQLSKPISQIIDAGVPFRELMVVIIDDGGVGYSEFVSWMRDVESNGRGEQIVYLDGGLAAYKGFLQFRQAVIDKQRRDLDGATRCGR